MFYITPDLRARGDKGTYDEAANVIVLTGNVVISRGSDIATGDCLRMKVETGESTLGCKVPGQTGPRQRPTTIINPQSNNNDE